MEAAAIQDILSKVVKMEYTDTPDVDRVNINFMLVHQQMGEQPLPISIISSFTLETTGQHWFRKLKVGQDEQELTFSWPDTPGIFIIHNLANGKALIRPTESEAKEVEKMILEVRRGDIIDLIIPNLPMVFLPQQTSKIFIRCQHGEAKVAFYVLPR